MQTTGLHYLKNKNIFIVIVICCYPGFMDNLAKEIESAANAAFVDKAINHSLALRPSLIDNSVTEQNDMLSYIKKGLSSAEEFLISVSFIRMSGLAMLVQTLKDIGQKKIKGRIITTDYLNYTEPKALRKLLEFPYINVRVVTEEAFHTKGYLFFDGEKNTVIIGSSNITAGALKSNREWNLRTTSLESGKLNDEFRKAFEELWDTAHEITEDWLSSYTESYEKTLKIQRTAEKEARIRTYTIEPNSMQKAAALSLKKMRDAGKDKALLIAATGTGKTYLAAFDVRSFNPDHMLFIVHREQILHDAADSFKDVLGANIENYIGFLTGNNKDYYKKYLFSTNLTMSKQEIYSKFPPDYFDYIVIDEVHRAGAESYRKIMNYFKPKFMLGMSATPDRTDSQEEGKNIYKLFDYNIALDIRLKDALEGQLLCPFHYYGVSDITINGEPIGEDESFSNLTTDERVRNILEKSEFYGFSGDRVKGLIFCSRQEEAISLSEEINKRKKNDKRNWQSAYVTGATSIETREEYVEQLQSDKDDESVLDFIITVDTFNEGIDIPKVNQIIMLRPTQSSIIFIQQLGRGLRKNAEGKEYLVAIDFIGNYRKSFLIPVALSGDNTYDKDNLRKYITEGSSVLPGTSTVDFDPIAKELIYKNIDTSDMTRMDFLKKEYFSLKSRIGRIPSISDFSKENAIDVLNFVDKSGSYYSFVKSIDKEYDKELDDDEETVIKYISEKFSNGKRRAELSLLNDLLYSYSEGSKAAEKDSEYMKRTMGQTFDSMIANLDMSFLKSQDSKKYGDVPLIEIRGGSIYPSKRLASMLEDDTFREILEDIITDGLRRNRTRYKNPYKDTAFVLYEKYTYEDVCRLLCWDKNMNALNIGGYFYDKKTKTLPVFINYEKDDGAIQYQDRFIDEENLIALSKKPRKIGSSDYNHFYKITEEDKDNHIYLFVRKNSEDERKEFYFLGEINATGAAIPVKVDNQDAFEIHYVIAMPVRRDIYDYLTS